MTSSGSSRPTPTEFTLRDIQTSVPEDAAKNLAEKIDDIVKNVRQRIVSDGRLEEVLRNGKLLQSVDDRNDQAPEGFTKDLIIDKLLDQLNYPYRTKEVNTPAEDEDQWVDYSVSLQRFTDIDSKQLLIEAEPINKNLQQRKHGVGQVKRWLHHEPFETNFGMATDGLKWIFLKKDPDTHTINVIESVDLRGICLALFENQATSKEPVEDILDAGDWEVLETFYEAFYFDNFTSIAAGIQSIIRKKKQEVSEAFYDEYIKIVFGIIDENTDGRDTDRCLVGDGIEEPIALTHEFADEGLEEQRRLFAVQLMNRLVFIKFLEDTGLVEEALLSEVKEAHEQGEHLNDFYQTFIKPLIYDVFNTPKGKRRNKIKRKREYRDIPYLNGGLFRTNLPREKEYHVSDTVLLEIVDLLEDYEFSTTGGPDELDPSILGTVFEKTINYLAGETGAQKDLGAYYTPDTITRFCAEKTVRESLIDRFKGVLQEEWGWREGEVEHYEEIYELIEGLSPNQDVVDTLIREVDKFRVLDPACGSGHFLTSVLNELISIRRSLYEKHEDTPSIHILKKRSVLRNLYGVDIVGPGVEITKLRLWLSIMSELDEADIGKLSPGELALPNVAFNIREGNSLVGYTDTQRLMFDDEEEGHQQSPLGEWVEKSVEELVEERQEMVNEFKHLYGEDAQALQDKIDTNDIDYSRQLNQKLLEDLREAEVAFEYNMDELKIPDLPRRAIHKVTIRFDDAIDVGQKDELSDDFQDESGMRINYSTSENGYVSISLTHEYLSSAPEDRLQRIFDEVENNIKELKIERYLTLEDLEDLEALHWPLEFYEVFENGGFDLVIGNPPYGIDISDAESALGDYTDENHSSMVFASRAEDLVNDDGQVAYVVPKVLTYAYSWTDARKHLLDVELDYLIDLREAFDGVKQEQIILIFSPTQTDDVGNVIVGRREEKMNGNGESFFEQRYQQSAFDEDCFFMWVDDDNEDLLTKLGDYDSFEDVNFAEATKGIDAFKSYLTGNTNDLLAYRGDDVGQFRFVHKSYLDPAIKSRSDFHLAGHGEKKVVFQRILAHVANPTDRIIIQCAIDYDEACVPDTAIHAIPDNHSLEFLCGLMNSSLFAWYAYNVIYNRAIRSMDLTPVYFGRLPAPPKKDDDLIEKIEECTMKIQEMDRSQSVDLLSKYDELNEAVFDLYQLGDNEREIIETETPPREETLLNW